MSYAAVGNGSLVLRFDENAINDMKARMQAYYDELSRKGIKAYRPGEYMMQVHQSVCEAEKEALEKEQPTEWLETALSGVGFSEIYFTKLLDLQLLYVDVEFDAAYREDTILELLKSLSPQTITGVFSFCGEDNGVWRLSFIGTSWQEQQGEIIYKDQTNTEQRRQIPSAGEDIWESLLARIQALIQSDQRSAAERGYLLVNAVREQDPDGVLAALTGWSMQALGAFVELWNQEDAS